MRGISLANVLTSRQHVRKMHSINHVRAAIRMTLPRRLLWLGLIGLLLIVCWLGAARRPGVPAQWASPSQGEPDRIDQAIARAMRFLKRQQLPSGAFPGVLCETLDLTNCVEDVSVFFPTFVLHALSFLPPEQTQRMRTRAVTFLMAAQHSPGIWSYWPKASVRHTWLPPDLDDTACARAALSLMRRSPAQGMEAILNNRRDSDGTFWTWIGLPSEANEMDCVVNANVVFALALEGRQAPQTVEYLNQVMSSGFFEHCSRFYPRSEVLFYAISRAYRDGGVRALQPAVAVACEQLRTRQQPDGGFGDTPPTAFAALTWLNAGQSGEALERAVNWLLVHQRRDGGWQVTAALYGAAYGTWISGFHSSEAMAAALALEALIKLHRHSNR